jgi:hypothetical protein
LLLERGIDWEGAMGEFSKVMEMFYYIFLEFVGYMGICIINTN